MMREVHDEARAQYERLRLSASSLQEQEEARYASLADRAVHAASLEVSFDPRADRAGHPGRHRPQPTTETREPRRVIPEPSACPSAERCTPHRHPTIDADDADVTCGSGSDPFPGHGVDQRSLAQLDPGLV